MNPWKVIDYKISVADNTGLDPCWNDEVKAAIKKQNDDLYVGYFPPITKGAWTIINQYLEQQKERQAKAQIRARPKRKSTKRKAKAPKKFVRATRAIEIDE